MDTIQDAIIIGGKLLALNMPGGAEILRIYAAMDHEVVRDIVRDSLAEVFCSYPDTFPTRGVVKVDATPTGGSITTSGDSTPPLAYIEIQDHGYFGSVAANVLSHSEIAPDDRGKVIVREYDSAHSARIPLDLPIEEVGVPIGTEVEWLLHPSSPLIVVEADGLDQVPEHRSKQDSNVDGDSFVPLLVYALPVYNLEPNINAAHHPHIPIAVAGYV